VEDFMKPFGGGQSTQGATQSEMLPAIKNDGKVSTKMLLDALHTMHNSQMEYQILVKDSIRTLAEKVANGGEEDLTEKEEHGRKGNTLLQSSEMANHTTSGNTREQETAMDISVQKMARKMFEMLDSDENNEISIEEAVTFVSKSGLCCCWNGVVSCSSSAPLFLSGNSSVTPTAEDVAAIYDTDGNGMIDLGEFTVIVGDM
jgi:hypothetical protein